eukprot:364774-Chlamydomonas_euryale.AAC.10
MYRGERICMCIRACLCIVVHAYVHAVGVAPNHCLPALFAVLHHGAGKQCSNLASTRPTACMLRIVQHSFAGVAANRRGRRSAAAAAFVARGHRHDMAASAAATGWATVTTSAQQAVLASPACRHSGQPKKNLKIPADADGACALLGPSARPARVRVTGSEPTKGMPVLSVARQIGSSRGLGAVTKGTPLRTVLSHPIPTPPRQPGRENRAQSR